MWDGILWDGEDISITSVSQVDTCGNAGMK